MTLIKEQGISAVPSRKRPKFGALCKAFAKIKDLDIIENYNNEEVLKMYNDRKSFIIPMPTFKKEEISFTAYIDGEITIEIEEWFDTILSIGILTAADGFRRISKCTEEYIKEHNIETIYNFVNNITDDMQNILDLI